MSGHGHDFDEFLRRVLQEQADAVEPADDGLERIRARLTRPRPAPIAWVMAVFSGAWRRVRGAALSASAWLRTLAGGTSARLRPPGGGRPRRWRQSGRAGRLRGHRGGRGRPRANPAAPAGGLWHRGADPLARRRSRGRRRRPGRWPGGGRQRRTAGPRRSVQQPAGQAGTPAPIGQPRPEHGAEPDTGFGVGQLEPGGQLEPDAGLQLHALPERVGQSQSQPRARVPAPARARARPRPRARPPVPPRTRPLAPPRTRPRESRRPGPLCCFHVRSRFR